MPKKILVVEDEREIVELLIAIFDHVMEHETLYARDGEEALWIARTKKPDLILLDIQLPALDGYEVCRSVKSDPTISSTKVLMLSGLTQISDRQKAHEAGADGFIAKPFNSRVLVEKVEEVLSLGQERAMR